MRISDWSSDVCSSDLVFLQAVERVDLALDRRFRQHARGLLERRGRNERPGLERGLGDPEQHRLAVGKLAALGSGLGVDLVHLLAVHLLADQQRSEEHTSELQSLMRISYAVFCLKKKK